MRRPRLLIALGIVVMGLITYWQTRSVNPVTGKVQHIALTTDQEIALGLQSAPGMAQQFGGLDPDDRAQAFVTALGTKLVRSTVASSTPYQFSFHVLADDATVNAFALPGGPVFITHALLARLENEAQVAGVLGHEIGHVIGRHSAQQIAKSNLAESLVRAIGVAASDDQGNGRGAAALAGAIAQMVQMKYGRQDELESDTIGVKLMSDSGYDPRAMVRVMDILREATGGGQRQPEFMSTHPDPGNRQELIEATIEKLFPGGVPSNLTLGQVFQGS
ncbi:MAG: M48 family metalloprotease [Thermoanaerobaculia bacterium]